MKTFAVALAALLVAGAVAQPVQQQPSEDKELGSLIETLEKVFHGLGGFEGSLSKLETLVALMKKAYEDKGVGGWVARNLIKAQLTYLKQRAIQAENAMINQWLDELEKKIGLRAEAYGFIDTVQLIRDSIRDIVDQIHKAQKEHDTIIDEAGKNAADKVQKHIESMKETLRKLKDQLIDIILRRNQASTYGIFDEQIAKARDQVRSILGKLQQVKEELHKSSDEAKKALQKHLDEIKQQLKEAVSRLLDLINGKAPKAVSNEIVAEEYILDDFVAAAIKQVRERIFGYLKQLKEQKDIFDQASGDLKKEAAQHIADIKDRIKEAVKNLTDLLKGKIAQ